MTLPACREAIEAETVEEMAEAMNKWLDANGGRWCSEGIRKFKRLIGLPEPDTDVWGEVSCMVTYRVNLTHGQGYHPNHNVEAMAQYMIQVMHDGPRSDNILPLAVKAVTPITLEVGLDRDDEYRGWRKIIPVTKDLARAWRGRYGHAHFIDPEAYADAGEGDDGDLGGKD